MHLRHVGTPAAQTHRLTNIVVAAHRFIQRKGAHKAHHRRGHAVTRVRVDVRAETGEQFRGIAFPDGPLTRSKRLTVASGPFREVLNFSSPHHIEPVPSSPALAFAAFVIAAVFHAQHRLRQTILYRTILGGSSL